MLKLFKKLYKMTGEDSKKVNIAIVLQFLDTFLSFVPLGTALLFFENYTKGTLTEHFWLIALGMLISGVLCRILIRYQLDKNQYSVIYRMFYDERIKIADHLKKINMGFFNDDNIGNISTVLVNGMGFIEEKCMSSLIMILTSSVNLLFIGLMLFVMNVRLGILFVATILLVTVFLIPYQRIYVTYSKKHNKADEVLTSAIIEYVRNIAVIKAFHLLGKHERSNNAFELRRKTDLEGEKLNIPFIVGSMCIMAIAISVIIHQVVQMSEWLQMHDMIILIMLALYIFNGLEAIVLKLGIISIAKDSFNNIDELYEQEEMMNTGDKKPNHFDVKFENVTFAYEQKNVIENISFELKEHTMTALVGLSGSGKSTLVNLIARFFDIQKGRITIGGVDVREMSQETLYNCISMVFQNVYLFKDTIYNNIVFGNEDATKEDVMIACKKAKCYDFIMKLPEGFDTVVGEAGLSLSGGERQRLSIARAILKDAPIILLDEATASVDPDNESDIQEAINALVQNKTILVIAHKLSCVKNANKILVLDEGQLVQEGVHHQLIEKEGLYASLWKKRVESKSWKIASK